MRHSKRGKGGRSHTEREGRDMDRGHVLQSWRPTHGSSMEKRPAHSCAQCQKTRGNRKRTIAPRAAANRHRSTRLARRAASPSPACGGREDIKKSVVQCGARWWPCSWRWWRLQWHDPRRWSGRRRRGMTAAPPPACGTTSTCFPSPRLCSGTRRRVSAALGVSPLHSLTRAQRVRGRWRSGRIAAARLVRAHLACVARDGALRGPLPAAGGGQCQLRPLCVLGGGGGGVVL